MKKITAAEIMEILEESKYNYYGVRGASESDMENLERGYLDCSYDWYDNTCTDEQLNGTCALGVNEYMSENRIAEICERAYKEYAKCKGTNTILLIADNAQEYGNDDGEVILGNGFGADVIAIIEL